MQSRPGACDNEAKRAREDDVEPGIDDDLLHPESNDDAKPRA